MRLRPRTLFFVLLTSFLPECCLMDCLAVLAKADAAVLIGVLSLLLSLVLSLFAMTRGWGKKK